MDVVIIGGGPAGSAAAISCRQRGLSVLLIEESPSEATGALAPGETLHPAMERLFRSLGVDQEIHRAGFFRHTGHWIEMRGGCKFRPFGSDPGGPWRGYLVDRAKMQGTLLTEAARRGACVLQGLRAVRPIMRNGRVAGVLTTNGAYESGLVLDASGHRSWLGRHLDLQTIQVSPTLIARYGWVQFPTFQREEEPVPRFRVGDGGWEWSAPIRRDCRAWVRLGLLHREERGKRAVPAEGGIPLGAEGARDVTWKLTFPCAGPGYALIGDSAWVLDPACSHGILKAVLSGIIAAETIAASSEPKEDAYCTWMKDWFCSDAEALIELYTGAELPAPWLHAARERLGYIATIPSSQAFSMSPTA